MSKKQKNVLRRTAAFFMALLSAVFAVLFCSGCSASRTLRYTDSSFSYFDTYCEITLYTTDQEVFRSFADTVWRELRRYHCLYDIYHEYDGMVNLKTVNDTAALRPIAVEEDLMELLLFSAELYETTEGRCNIAMGSLLFLWHDYREAGVAIPSEQELAEAADHIRFSDLILDREAGTVAFADPLLRLDVGAVAKGFAAQRIYEKLLSAGYTDFLLNIGGTVLAAGEKTESFGRRTPWRIAVENPKGGALCMVELRDTVLVTSGSYQRYYEVDGVSYHHIIDPATRYPSAYHTSVTVYARDAGIADGLSTALFCLPREEGQALLRQYPGAEALWMDADGTVFRSDGFPQEITP